MCYSLFISSSSIFFFFFFFFNDTATTEIYTLSLHDALPICNLRSDLQSAASAPQTIKTIIQAVPLDMDEIRRRSEEHTSELQSPCNLVCRLLLEKKKRRQQRRAPQQGQQCSHRLLPQSHPDR